MAKENAVKEDVVEEVSESKKSSSGELKSIGLVGKMVGVLVVVWLISVSYYAFAFFTLGMLPAIVAVVIDRGVGRFASKTVTACNFIGIVPFLFDIGMTYERSLAAKQLMLEPITWLIIFGFSSLGWMLIWILPQTTLIFFTLRADVKTKHLKVKQEKLLDEWGEEVKSGKKRGEI